MNAIALAPTPAARASAIRLTRSMVSRRALWGGAMNGLAILATLLALLPLSSLLWTVVANGGSRLSWSLLVHEAERGGIGHAIQGTLIIVGLAALLSVPLGILAGIFLAEFAGGSRAAQIVHFSAKVLSGMPSILAGVFAFALIVQTTKSNFTWAAGVALGLLMTPTVVLNTEQALLAVPNKLREAALGLGATRTQMVLREVVPTAWPALLTGVLLAVARACGETAPLLFTAVFSRYWFTNLSERTGSMAVFIFNSSSDPDPKIIALAWTAALVLVAMVLALNILGRALSVRATR